MADEQTVDAWVDAISAHNRGKPDPWTARFAIEGVPQVQAAVTNVETVSATLGPNGPHGEYAVRFAASAVRDVVIILAKQGARLSDDQDLAPLA